MSADSWHNASPIMHRHSIILFNFKKIDLYTINLSQIGLQLGLLFISSLALERTAKSYIHI